MSPRVKYAMVGLLTMLMLVYMTGYAGSANTPTSAVTDEQIAGSENTKADERATEESMAPDSVLVGFDTFEIIGYDLRSMIETAAAGEKEDLPPSEPETEPEEVIPSPYDGVAVVTINEAYLRVRADATTESATVGRMYPQSKATILESKNGWYHISSGNVDGWISGDYAVTGHEAELFIKENFEAKLIINTEVLRMRAEPDVEGAFLDYVKEGQSYDILGEENGWYYIEAKSGLKGYVSGEYAYIGADMLDAMTLEEATAYERQKELEAKAEQMGAQLRGKTAASEAEVTLLAALCRHEAGHRSYEGALAVANVVINRMRNGYWGTSMTEVIYAPGQFQYVNDGALDKFMADPGSVCIQAARDALDGLNNVGTYLFFRSAKSADVSQFASWVNIGGNIFYRK